MIAPAFLLGASLFALAGPASSTSETFSGADALVIEGFVGTIEVTEGRTLAIDVMGAPEGGPLEISRNGGTVSVVGDKDMVKDLYRKGSPYRDGWKNWRGHDDAIVKFGEFLEDYPVISVTIPEGSDFEISHAAMIIEAELSFGSLEMSNLKEVYGSLGDADEAKIGIGGMGELSIGDVEDNLYIAIGGSGDIYAGDSGETTVRIGGSGDVDLGDVDGSLSITIGGSGDVVADRADSIALKISGSGDVEIGDVDGDTDVSINGSGDYAADSVNGALKLSINGSGDIDIEDGRSTSTQIRISGNGDINFGGVANDPNVDIRGGGDVFIKDYTGNVKVSGDKDDVRIGDLTFDDKDR